ncbi:leucyl aminopeptidase [Devosia sp. A369]
MATQLEMVNLFRSALQLCKVSGDETVIILCEGEIRADYATACLLAAREIGANAFQIKLAPRAARGAMIAAGRNPVAGNRHLVEVLKGADIIIDLMGMLFSHEQEEICASGTRMLFIHEPFDILSRNFPDADLRRRIEFGETLLANAKEMRIWSDAGTDARYQLGQYRVMTQYGFTDTPGRWDHLGTGQVLSQAYDGMVEGQVVVTPGDRVMGFGRCVESSVALTISGGRVTSIEGSGVDAAMMRDYIADYDDPRAYAISHIGFGLLKPARWYDSIITRTATAEIGVNSLSYYGNVLFSLGPNTELGGTNDTACHLDIPLRNASLSLDGRVIVENGKIVIPELQA